MNLDAFLQRGLTAQRVVNELLSEDQQARELLPDGSYRVRCSNCGTSVSNPLPVAVIVRAWVECADCLQRRLTEEAEATP